MRMLNNLAYFFSDLYDSAYNGFMNYFVSGRKDAEAAEWKLNSFMREIDNFLSDAECYTPNPQLCIDVFMDLDYGNDLEKRQTVIDYISKYGRFDEEESYYSRLVLYPESISHAVMLAMDFYMLKHEDLSYIIGVYVPNISPFNVLTLDSVKHGKESIDTLVERDIA